MTAGFPLSPDILVQLGTLGPAQLAWLSGYCWSQSTHAQAHPGTQALAGISGWTGLPTPTGQPGWPGQPAWPAAHAGIAAQQAVQQALAAQLQAQLQGQAWAQAHLQGQLSAAAAQQAWAQLQAQAQPGTQACAPGGVPSPHAGFPQTGAAQPGFAPWAGVQPPAGVPGAWQTGAQPAHTQASPAPATAQPATGAQPAGTSPAAAQPPSAPAAATPAAQPQSGNAQPAAAPSGSPSAAAGAARRITILSASQTGNARRVAQQLHDKLKAEGLSPKLAGVGDYKSKTLPDEDIVVLVTSTQGEGEPPEEAVPLHKFLFGKKSPKLDGLHFAVLGLGDSSYPKFCQAGRDFDAQLEKLGAQRLHERTDCDLDFQATATAWIDSVTQKLQKLAASAAASPAAEGAGNACAAPASSAAQNPGTTAPAGAGAGAAAASATAASQTSAGTQAGTAPQAGSTTQTGAAGSVPQTGAGNQPAPGAPAYAGQQPAQPSPAQTGISHAAPAAAPATPRFSPLPAGYPFPGFPFTIVGSPAPMPSGFSAGATAGAAGLLHALGQGIPGLGLLPGAGGVPLQNPFLDPAVASSTLQQAAALQAASLQALALQAGIAFPGQVPGGLMPQGMPGAQGMPGIPAAPGGMPGALPGLDGGGLGYGLYAAPDLQGDVAVQADPQVAQHAATALAEAQVAPGTEAQPETSTWTRATPFTATLSARQKITARKAEKDVQHIEIDLEGSGIQYQPGDALGVWPVNAPALVSEILSLHQLKGDETVKLADGTESTLRDALTHHADITQNTPTLVEQYAALSKLRPLQELVENREALDALLATTPPVGLFAEYPHPLPAQQLYSLFRPQAPRLYSIASAQDDVGEAVHLTVGVVHFQHHGQHYMGAASGYLGHLLEEDDEVRVFVEPNRHFRLPEDDDTPIIMIGAGTGVAPFRAFMQQREANGAGGKNWLIFGNQRFTDDFLYQAEWLQHRKSGLLTRADLAWSRQGEQKVYVQHKLLEAGADVWQWLQEGAHVYVCGDASRMARDVENALLDIIRTHGGLDEDDADDYLNTLREDRRYQRDVY